MASRVQACAGGIAIVAGLLGAPPTAAADPVEPLTIVVVIVDYAQLPERVVWRAQTEATRIYRSLGITLAWSNTLESSVHPRMIVNVVAKPTGKSLSVPESLAIKSADWRVLGVAPGHKERRDRTAWAFYERILDVATILGVDPGLLLGHVIAHELGHLLLPYDSHSQAGLMSAGWDKSQAANAVMGNLKFNPGEAALVRRSVARIVAGQRDSNTPITVTRTPN